MDVNDKIILERDIKQLQLQISPLKEKVAKLERDQLILIDAKVKLEKELTALSEQKRETLKEITEEKSRWAIVQQAEKESLDRQDLDAKKILNREGYVATQEQQLKIKLETFIKQETDVVKREKILIEKEATISEKQAKAERLVREKQLLVEKFKTEFGKHKESFIKQLKEWDV